MRLLVKRRLIQATILLALAIGGISFAEDAAPQTGSDTVAAANGESRATSEAAAAIAQGDESGVTRSVKLDEAVSLALANNVQLASDAIDLRIKKRSSEYAWNVFIPSAQVSGTLARSNLKKTSVGGLVSTPTGVSYASIDIPLDEKDHWSMVAGLSIGLNLNAALIEGLRATRQSYEAGKLTLDQARQDTERNVRKAFYGILVQQESLKLLREKLAASEDRLRQAQINYRNGAVPELTVLQTQLSVETQKPVLREAEIALDQQKKLFTFIIGLPVGTEVTLEGTINPTIKSFDEDELVSKYLANRLDIAFLAKNLELLNTQVRATRLQLFTPSVSLSQSWQPMKAPIDSGEWTDSAGAFSVTVLFDLTGLIPFSRAGLALAEAEDGAQKLNLAKGQTEYNAELEIRDLVKRLDKARASIATMDLSVSIAEKAYRLTEQAYRAGSVEYLDLKDAENSLLQAEIGVLSEKYNYLSTLLDLETAVNARLE